MSSQVASKRARIFGKAFKVWGGIMALPGVFLTFQIGSGGFHTASFSMYDFMRMGLYYAIAPGVAFGTVGAAALTFLAWQGHTLRAFAVGIAIGFLCPAVFFAGMFFLLPKNEGSLGWVLFGVIFSMTGIFAGVMAANAIASEIGR